MESPKETPDIERHQQGLTVLVLVSVILEAAAFVVAQQSHVGRPDSHRFVSPLD